VTQALASKPVNSYDLLIGVGVALSCVLLTKTAFATLEICFSREYQFLTCCLARLARVAAGVAL
jgi:hypothetical protein